MNSYTVEGEVETHGALYLKQCLLTQTAHFILSWSISLTFSSLLSLTFKISENQWSKPQFRLVPCRIKKQSKWVSVAFEYNP